MLTPAHIPYLTGTDCSSCHAANYVAGGFGPTNMSAAKHAFVPTTCDTCHEAGLSFYLGASTPALQGRPADHMAPRDGAAADRRLLGLSQHDRLEQPPRCPPATCRIPATRRAPCVIRDRRPRSYATLASIAVLHTGITTGCAQCHGGTTRAHLLQQQRQSEGGGARRRRTSRPSAAPIAAPAMRRNYAAGGFGPMNMTAGHARRRRHAPATPAMRPGLSFYMGAASPALQGRPADHTTGQQVAPNDCSLCHTTANWNSHGAADRPYAESGQSDLQRLPHRRRRTTITRRSPPIAVLHTGISSGCAQCHGGTTAAHLVQQLHDRRMRCSRRRTSRISPGTDCSSCHSSSTYAAGGFGPMNMTQATHAFVATTCNTCHEAGLSFYMGAASPALQGRPADHTAGQMVAPNDCSLCHTTANWNSTVMPAGHMPNPGQSGLHRLSHRGARELYARRSRPTRCCTPASPRGCITCHGAPNATRAGVLSQLHAEGRGAFAGAHPDQHRRRARLATRSASRPSAARR